MIAAPQPRSMWFAFEGKLSWDGILTFLGGLLAFLAIWRQVRHADRGLQQQLKDERDVRTGEQIGRRRAVAEALLAEVETFDEEFIIPVARVADRWSGDLRSMGGVALPDPPTSPFPLYRGNARYLGEMGGDVARSVAGFYVRADALTALLSRLCGEQTGVTSCSRPGLPCSTRWRGWSQG